MIWFGWVLWHINHCRLFNAKSSLYIYIKYIYDLVWLGFMTYQPLQVIQCQVLFIHIYLIYMICKHIQLIKFLNELKLIHLHTVKCLQFNLKSIICLHTYQIYMIWFCWALWHINHCRLFNAKSSLYIYIKNIEFGWVGFYGIITIVGYSMPNPFYTYIFRIYDL